MKVRKPNPRSICCASIVAISLAACTHSGNKLKGQNLTGNGQASSTTEAQKLYVGKGKRNPGLRVVIGPDGKPHYDNLWDRLFDLYALPSIEHPAVSRELDWFINHPTYIDRVQKRAEPFLYSIVRQVEKQNIPGELALLPVIESAFQAHAISPANAAGIWQFIPSTGKRYGLKQSRSYDGRRDIYASTRAAIKYLKKLHGDFSGDWLLAIAAYNCGEGAVSRAIQRNAARNLPTDFWSLELPQETRSYVPRLLAVAKLFTDAQQYGIDLRPIPNKYLFRPVKINSQLDLALAADAADISLDRLFELNPGFKNQHPDIDGSFRLFIPADKSKGFKEELARLADYKFSSSPAVPVEDAPPPQPVPVPQTPHQDFDQATAQTEEQTTHSANFEPTVRKRIKDEIAPKDSSSDRVVTSKYAKSNTATQAVMSRELSNKKPEKRAAPSIASSYEVREGETLFSIAKKHHVDVSELMDWNNINRPNGIRPGMNLVLSQRTHNKSAKESADGRIQDSKSKRNEHGSATSSNTHYKVKHGDSILAIAQRFHVSVAEIRKLNGTKAEKELKPGTVLALSSRKD